ncbi:hypothetical protein EIP91_009905 [Steccherinum ochraceum]|uniref:protein-tyrosine-phosphatase n=1 Tax=Steccherinum ochraceum TaxID=92696 RepID=A0A4R0RT78_9APHY|nr:hypothetical protein EIP91_009905 [Steccherinum ochraceum]
MDQIIENLWLGDLPSALRVEALRRNNIHSIVSAMTFVHHQIDIYDTEDTDVLKHFATAIAFIEKELDKGRGVLVHCFAGVSRSATIVAAYLMHSRGLDPTAALNLIRERRPHVDPNEGFMKQLDIFYKNSFKSSAEDKSSRMFYAERTAKQMISGDGTIDKEMLATYVQPSPATQTSSRRRLRCKMCRQNLATRENMVGHGLSSSGTSHKPPLLPVDNTDVDAATRLGEQFSESLSLAEAESSSDTSKALPISEEIPGRPAQPALARTFAHPSEISAQLYSNPALAALRSPDAPIPLPAQKTKPSSPIAAVSTPILADPKCSGYFVEPMKWMDSSLSDHQTAGKIVCPNLRCKAKLGNYDWAGDEVGPMLSKILDDAFHLEQPQYTLRDVYTAVEATSTGEEVDVLMVIPSLLLSNKEGGIEMLNMIGRIGSARESIISLQEVLGRLSVSLASEAEDSQDEEDTEDSETVAISSASQLVRVLDSYALVLPRLPKRRKPPSDTLQPLFSQLESVVDLAGRQSSDQAGGQIVISVGRILSGLCHWIRGSEDDEAKCKDILFKFACSTLKSCSRSIHCNLAQNVFEKLFPRYVSGPVPSSSQDVEDPVQSVLSALQDLGFTITDYLHQPSIGSLVLLAHSEHYDLGSDLSSLLRWLLASIQTNTALDESLAILLTSLFNIKAGNTLDVPPEFIIPLVHVLGPLAGSHHDPLTRHLIFRLLSLALSIAPPEIRLELLRDLLSDSEALTAQMQVAAIGLVREAAMEALAMTSGASPFASPTLLREIGPLIFSLQSPEIFSDCEVPLDDFMDSAEPLRLIEGLTLLYLLVQRDTGNLTGIRNRREIDRISQSFLTPLDIQLTFWKREPDVDEHEAAHKHDAMQLGILDMWLERTTSALRAIS